MNLLDLFETPIADFSVHGEGTSFSSADVRLFASEKAKAKYFRAFTTTPFIFKIYVVQNTSMDGNSVKHNAEVDQFARTQNAGIHSSFECDDFHVNGESGIIKMVLLSNLSEINGKLPVTPWILAHKVGHVFQDEMYRTGWQGAGNNTIIALNRVISRIPGGNHSSDHFSPSPDTANYLTMKSARDKNLANPFEIFAEIIAQFLITGKVKTQSSDLTIDPKLNTLCTKLLKSVEGKVLVEL